MVTLEDESQIMEEIVVTGYQQMKRGSATGSFQTISAEDMAKRYTGDITSNLEVRCELVSACDGLGNAAGITIRGTGSSGYIPPACSGGRTSDRGGVIESVNLRVPAII